VVGDGYPKAVPGMARLGLGGVHNAIMIPAIGRCREALVRRAFKNNTCTINDKISRSGSPILLFKDNFSLDTLLFIKERDPHIKRCLAARRVRVDLRRKAGVGASGVQPGSNAKERRSPYYDQPRG
jgi:hypothetical protein